MKPIVEELKNGLKVILRPTTTAPVVAFQVWVGVGSADENPGEEGLAHVLEHMLFKGTKKRPVGEIARDVERAGGQINAWTSYDETVYHITMASRYQDQGLDILSDAVQNALLDPEELSKELMVIQEEILMGEDSAEQVLIENLFRRVFKRHPYGRPVIGSSESVRAFDRDKVQSFYKRWYVPANMIFSIAGDFDEKAMLRKVRAVFRKPGPANRGSRGVRPKEVFPRRPRFISALRPVSEAHAAIAFPIPGLAHEDVPALDLLSSILGQGMSSRLERTVKRQLGLVNDIRVMAYTPRDYGIFSVLLSCQPQRLEQAVAAVARELGRVTEELVMSQELQKAKTLIESESIYSEETVDGLARKSAFFLMHARDVEFERKYLAMLGQITEEELLEIARRHLVAEHASVSVVVPDPAHRAPEAGVPWIAEKEGTPAVDETMLSKMLLREVEAIGKAGPSSDPVKSGEQATLVVELSTGDRLLIRRDPTSKIVAARAAFMGGLRLERHKEAGLFNLLSNTMVRGTEDASSEEVASMMDALACSISGFTGRNTVGIHGEFLSNNFADGFALMASCLRRPAFPEKEVEREKELLVEDIRQSLDDPGRLAFHLLFKNLFDRHPYGRPTHGTEESLQKLSSKSLKAGLMSTTGAGDMVLSVVGGVDPEEVHALAETLLVPEFKKGRGLKEPGDWRPPKEPKQVLHELPKEQSHVVIGFPGTTLTSDDRFAVEILTEILGGQGGRLFEQVREVKGLAYSVTAMAIEGIEPGHTALFAATSPGNENAVVQAMIHEIQRITDERPSADEMRRIKHHLIGTRAIAWQKASARAASMALDELYGNGHDAALHYAERIDAVEAHHVVEAARRYLNLSERVVVCVGPKVARLNLI
jgi:zinc protease